MKNIEEVIEFFKLKREFMIEELNDVCLKHIIHFESVQWSVQWDGNALRFVEIVNKTNVGIDDATLSQTTTLTVYFNNEDYKKIVVAMNKNIVETRIENENIRL